MRLRSDESKEVPDVDRRALDVHRRQVSFEYVDTDSGRVRSGRLIDPHRTRLGEWIEREFHHRDDVAMALEGCTGWRYVAEELAQAGVEDHLADPAEVQTRRGKKRRAKTDRSDCRLMRELLARHELPESWIPPVHVLEARGLARLYKAVLEERTAWMQRMQATLFHHGAPEVGALGHPVTRLHLTGPTAG
jgi:transposase